MKTALIAFDKFKDALSAHQVCEAAAHALADVQPAWTLTTSPLADGGDGFCDTLTRLCQGSFHSCQVQGPLGKKTEATYGIVKTTNITPAAQRQLDLPPETQTLAIVEFAQSSGIALVPPEERSPWTTTSYGLGQTIAHAQKQGAEAILIGLGGSATNDLAIGALQALGYQLLRSDGSLLDPLPTPATWSEIDRIAPPDSPITLPIRVACDVENPLLGPNGATAIFGPQKGLEPTDFDSLEAEMHRLATLLCQATHSEIQSMDTPGAGAAGGAAFGLMLGLSGQLVPGAELVFAWSNLHQKLAAADLVMTGEGRFDASSLQGKGPGSLAKHALQQNKELLVLAGSLGDLPDPKLAKQARAISPPELPLAEALLQTEANLQAAIRSHFSQ
ncbi:glycerate kinase family protein [Pelagicoccus mobilis]|uniref:Glycerate kinase n=1 Tax=Pelagicoccus mobilis TaxID=415221 RepID=A0A934RZQ8_9BACT|nr:glycerate kinase [Pelagicoccus mobilis]MBK1878324.1 glycerate kinase [Pelagicoccus mobilis]